MDQADWQYEPFVRILLVLGTADAPFDISSYTGVSSMFKGSAHTTQLEMISGEDFGFHLVSVPASDVWVLVELPLEDFPQPSWAEAVDFNPTDISILSMQVTGADGEAGTVVIDNVRFYVD